MKGIEQDQQISCHCHQEIEHPTYQNCMFKVCENIEQYLTILITEHYTWRRKKG